MNEQVGSTASSDGDLIITSRRIGQNLFDRATDTDADLAPTTTAMVGTSVAPQEGQNAIFVGGNYQQSGTGVGIGQDDISTQPVPVKVHPQAQPYLTGEINSLVEALRSVVLGASNRSQVRISSIEIGLKHLHKDRRRNPYLWMDVNTGPEVLPNQALALWDAIGLKIDQWLPKLSPRARRLFDDRMSMSVVWVEKVAG